MGDVLKANTLTDLHEIINKNDRVVIDFAAPAWCVPCQRLEPHFKKAAESSDATFVEVDMDKADDGIKNTYPIMSVPMVFYVQKDAETREIKGRTALAILREIEE